MLRGRRERGSSSALPSTSLLIPPNPAIADPGSSTTARGGILLNPLNKDGSTSVSPQGRSSSLASSTSSRNTRGHAASVSSARRSTSLSSTSSSINSSSSSAGRSSGGNDEEAPSIDSASYASTRRSTSASSSSASPRLKFAPLPESGRIKRSNSITRESVPLSQGEHGDTVSSFSSLCPESSMSLTCILSCSFHSSSRVTLRATLSPSNYRCVI